MKTSKFFPGICLAVTLVMGLHVAAWAALVNSPDQPGHPQGNSGSDTSGILSFATLYRIKADGTIDPFPFSLPANRAMVITWLQVGVNAVDTLLATNADLRMVLRFPGPVYDQRRRRSHGGPRSRFCHQLPGIYRSSL